MKNSIKTAGFALLMLGATFTFSGCDNTEKNESEQVAEVYQCPMDCEKGKTYTEPGKCPVCEMDLQPITND